MAKQQLHARPSWLALLLLVTVATTATLSFQAVAQDSENVPRKPSAFPNAFGRFVTPPAPQIQEPSPPRETKGLGGFFMPLKSFSNPFRNVTRSGDDTANLDPRNASPTREPFSDPETIPPPRPRPIPPPPERSSRAVLPQPPQPQPATTAESIKAFIGPESNVPKEETATSPPPDSPKTYTATPKTENLDAVGTSRKTKSSGVKKQVNRNAKNESEATRTESNLTESNTATVSQTGSAESSPATSPPAVPRKSSVASSSASRPRSNPAPSGSSTRSPLPGSDQSDSAQTPSVKKQGTVRSKLASASVPSNRPKMQTASNLGLDIHAPGLNLVLTGPDSILVGRAIPYELTAANEGERSLQGLTVRLIVPANVTIEDPIASDGLTRAISEESGNGLTWEIGQLPGGERQSLKISLRTEQPEHFAMSLDWRIENPAIQVPIRVHQPQLILALEGTSEAEYGRPQTYRLRVRNPGNATAEQVRILLQASPGDVSEELLGDLPPGTERVVEAELTFQQAGKVEVSAKAISESSNVEASRKIEVEVQHSHLVATWDGPAEFYQGNIGDYILTLENRGAIEAVDNKCCITIPEGIEVVTLPPGVSRSKNQLRWDVPRIEVGKSLDWKFQFAMNVSGDHQFTVDTTSSTGEPAQASVQTRVDAIADLALSVNDPISPAPVGKPVVYQITISNRGKKVAEDVFVIAQFSEGIEPTRIEGHTGKLVPGQALFDNIPKIEPGQELVLTVTAQASKPGSHRFRAAVRCQGSEDDLLKEESTRYTASGIGAASK